MRRAYGALLGGAALCGCAADATDAIPREAWTSSAAAVVAAPKRDLGRETLAASDGWASEGAGTTAGSAASAEQVYVVTTRAELIAALNDGVPSPASPPIPSSAPKIIYVNGTIDFNVNDDNLPLSCADYYQSGYTVEGFLTAYDPATWGKGAPTGPLEDARAASQAAQQARVRMRVGSNTTIVGLGKRARLRGVWLDIRGSATAGVTNVIIRNLTFEDTYDCFPVWAPTDGALGSWNALYDSISLRFADHVWVDHDTFRDRDTADELQPNRFGVLNQMHDGQLDITNASDLVTVSYNRFLHHDKVMLIGSSDGAAADRGKLRVTLHHNLFEHVGQRAPRVRFGQVDVYDNEYDVDDGVGYQYSWGVGIESAIIAENNVFKADEGVDPARFVTRFNGTSIFENGTLQSCARDGGAFSAVAAWNAINDPDLSGDVGWVPALRIRLDPAHLVARKVPEEAGPIGW